MGALGSVGLAWTLLLGCVPHGATRLGESRGPVDTAVASSKLVEKAGLFREALLARHVSREGVVLYRIDLRSIASDLSVGTYPYLADTPTFTGLWAAAACTQLSLGIRPSEAKSDAQRALAGLRMLMEVTGVRGLLARGIRRDQGRDVTGLRGHWFPGGPGFEEYVFKGDVSMDQYANGLLPAVAECATHFPEQTRQLVTDFAAHLVEHDLKLIDPNGERTRFGDLSPRSGFGFNSIAQLTAYAAFAWASELEPDAGWQQWRDRLRDTFRVVARARRTNLRLFGITNHSNDLMSWNLYRALVPLARRSRDPSLADLRHGMAKARERVRADGSAYFDALACDLEPETCEPGRLRAAWDQLARFPLEKRRLDPAPELLHLRRRLVPGRKFEVLASERVPIELRPASSFEWKSSPYRLERPAAPNVEYTGIDYLSAVWVLLRASNSGTSAPPP